jgi:hypothetical protein
MNRIQFNHTESGGLELARQVVLERLRKDLSWRQFDVSGSGFDSYIEYIGQEQQARSKFNFLAQDILWELMFQGVILPGFDNSNQNLPWFHITEYGRMVLEENEFLPHDPTKYLEFFRAQIKDMDQTLIKYLTESLDCFTKGSLIASTVMLGVASERMFLLLCVAMSNALIDITESKKFEKIKNANSMKPKQDWVTNKINDINKKYPKKLPDDIETNLNGIFNFIRKQRNDLGHPQEIIPNVTREQSYINLRIFPGYCKIVNEVIEFLKNNKI